MSRSYQDMVDKEVADALEHFAEEITEQIVDRDGDFFEIDAADSYLSETVGNDGGYSPEDQQLIIHGSDHVDEMMREQSESMASSEANLDSSLDQICIRALQADVRNRIESVMRELKSEYKEDAEDAKAIIKEWLDAVSADNLLSTIETQYEVDEEILTVGLTSLMLDERVAKEVSELNEKASSPGVIGGQISSLNRKLEAINNWFEARDSVRQALENSLEYMDREQSVRVKPTIKYAEASLDEAAEALYSEGYQTETITELKLQAAKIESDIAALEALYQDDDTFINLYSVELDAGRFYGPMMAIIEDGEEITPATASMMLKYVSEHNDRTAYPHPLFSVLAVTALALRKDDSISLTPTTAGYAAKLIAGGNDDNARFVADIWVGDVNAPTKTVIGQYVYDQKKVDTTLTQAVLLHLDDMGAPGFRAERLFDLVERGGDLDFSDKELAEKFAKNLSDSYIGHHGFARTIHFMIEAHGEEAVDAMFQQNRSEALHSAVMREIISSTDKPASVRKNKI